MTASTPKVYDIDGSERSLAWLAENYGCHPEFVADKIDVSVYARVFALVAIYVVGDLPSIIKAPALFKIEVRGPDGQPWADQPACLSWPSLERPSGELPDLSNTGVPYLWTRRGVAQRTNAGGLTGYGLGSSFGPLYQAWVISPNTPSDCLVAGGMKGGTNHFGPLHAVFQLVSPDPVVDPPDPPAVDLYFARGLALAMAGAVVERVDEGESRHYIYMTAEEIADRALEIASRLADT